MQVLICNVFGLKMPVHAPNGGFGGFYPKWEQSHRDPQKASRCCAEARHMCRTDR